MFSFRKWNFVNGNDVNPKRTVGKIIALLLFSMFSRNFNETCWRPTPRATTTHKILPPLRESDMTRTPQTHTFLERRAVKYVNHADKDGSISCLYVVSVSEFLLHPRASQQFPACIWFQYLGFACLSTTFCVHMVSIADFPCGAFHQISSISCAHWFQYLRSPGSAAPLATHWVSHLPSSSQFLLFAPLPAFQLRRGSTWCQPVWKCPTWGHSSGLNILHFVSRLPLWLVNNF